MPEQRNEKCNLEALANAMLAFTDVVHLTRYSLYAFDYGAPAGFRMAMIRPEHAAIVSQNGNAYEGGLGSAWAPSQRYWRDPSPANRDAMRKGLTLEAFRSQYLDGAPHPNAIASEGYTLNHALVNQPRHIDIQLDLFLDYASYVKLYLAFQKYFRTFSPSLLAIWGKEVFRREDSKVTLHFLDAGHVALQTHVDDIAIAMKRFFAQAIPTTSEERL